MRQICFYYCIYLLKSKCRNTPSCIIFLCYLCGVMITFDITIGSIVTSLCHSIVLWWFSIVLLWVLCIISVWNVVLLENLNQNRSTKNCSTLRWYTTIYHAGVYHPAIYVIHTTVGYKTYYYNSPLFIIDHLQVHIESCYV